MTAASTHPCLLWSIARPCRACCRRRPPVRPDGSCWHDENDPGIKLTRMPLDLGNHPARLALAGRLVGEVRVVSADFVWGPSDRSFEQVADPVLQDLVGAQPDRVFYVLSLQVLVDTRHGEGGIGPEIDAPDPAAIAQDDRLEHVLPAIGAVHVAGTQCRSQACLACSILW